MSLLGFRLLRRAKLARECLGKRPARVFSSQPPTQKTFAVAFDIDGVLLRGKQVIGNSPVVLKDLQTRRVPFLFMTNGGGVLETEKAARVSELLGVEVRGDQVQLAHSPMRHLVPKYQNEQVLVVGKERAKAILHDYGFRKVVTVGEYHSQFPILFPDYPPEPAPHIPEHRLPIKAIMVLMDPKQWHRELQIMNDILCSDGDPTRPVVAEQQVPVYFSCPDFEYVTEHHAPRYGAGVFGMVVAHLYQLSTGRVLQRTLFGKPELSTYAYAESSLQKQARSLGYDGGVSTVYAVGDNPLSDIAGANAARAEAQKRGDGTAWVSVLTRTGMFQGEGNDVDNPADIAVQDVEEAWGRILQREKV